MRARIVAAMAVGLSGLFSAPAAQASSGPIYWQFKNEASGRCLTTYASGAIHAIKCDSSQQSQQWHWLNSEWTEMRMLRNRWTGKCLVHHLDTDAVTSGACNDRTSRHWRKTSTFSPTGIDAWRNNDWNGTLANYYGSDRVFMSYRENGLPPSEKWAYTRTN
ncbi:hypothetical protein [Actinomadura rugatobispora]|uniref:Ricin B lectin domain-containing protein n=1 Tax=Actinomadura rugatobispora TaxID=1994 RepID=A0ABW1A7T0_9ACTN|nr:hypothetical protein GCM10010200_017610 [Actinomadura rugatobispora]